MPNSNLHIGDYNVQATGDITLQTSGDNVAIGSGSPKGSVMLTGQLQAGIQSGAAILSLSNEEEEIGNAVLTVGEIGTVKLGCGIPFLGSFITLEPEAIQITCGAPGVGASIRMTPESITFQVAEVTFTINPAGIFEEVAECTREHTPEGHNLTAAETEVNIGVAGEVKELPTLEAEVEGGSVTNETMAESTIDSMNSLDAAIMMVM
jgi:hypothetical protein